MPEVPPVAWAVGAASAPTVPTVPVPAPDPPSLRSIIFDDARGCLTPLRRDDAHRIIGSLDDLFANSSHDDEHSLYAQFFAALSDEWDVEDEGEVEDLGTGRAIVKLSDRV